MRSIVVSVLAAVTLLPMSAVGQFVPMDLRPLPATEWTWETARHLLLRAGFGGTKAEIDALHARGLDGAVDWLVDDGDRPTPELVALEPVGPDLRRTAIDAETEQERRAARQKITAHNVRDIARLQESWMTLMASSPRPLEEKMTLFWHGHFTSEFRDVRNAYHMEMQNRCLRRHATGNFRDFLRAIARDPAMLEYLDNNRNRRQRPNENFARELLELFTMGLGNYSESDIKNAARAFTGWTFRDDAFVFIDSRHDFGAKTFLGQDGRFDGDDILDIVLEQPVTAKFIVEKLFRYFVNDAPSDLALSALAREFRRRHRTPLGDRDYEIAPVLATLFRSRVFYADVSRGNRIKSPVEHAVTAIRQLELPAEKVARLGVRMANKMGQTLFQPPNVKGWKQGAAWVSTSTLFHRYNFAGLVTRDLTLAQFMETPKRRGARNNRAGNDMPASRPSSRSSQPGRPAKAPASRPSSQGQEPTSKAPKSKPTKPKSPAAKARDRRRRQADNRRRREAKQLLDVKFPFPAAHLVRRLGLRAPDDIVDHFTATCLTVPLDKASREVLVNHLRHGANGRGAAFDVDSKDATRRIRGMLHLLFATPHYQLS